MATLRRPKAPTALPMLDVYLPMMRTAAVLAAAQLGVFAALQRGAKTPGQLAKVLRADERGLLRLCDQLVTAGYLVRRGSRIANSAPTQRWFTPAGEVDYTPGLHWTRDAWRLVEDLGPSVRTGGPRTPLWERMRRQSGLGDRFAAYMHAFAEHSSPQIARCVRMPQNARRLLDVGGSHGLHAIAACRAHPNLTAVVFDHAVSLRQTKQHVRAARLQQRITTQAGDCVADDLGRDFDVVYYFSVAHNQTSAHNARVLRKCARALRPGGVLVIQDYVRGVVPEPYGSAFDLTLLLEVGTGTHDLAAFRAWVAAAGLTGFRHRQLPEPTMGSVITARKPR